MSEEGLSLEMQWPSRYGYWCWWPTFWPFDDVLCLHFLWGHNMLVLLLLLRQPLYPMLCPQILKSIVVCWGTRYCEWFLQTLSYPTQMASFPGSQGKETVRIWYMESGWGNLCLFQNSTSSSWVWCVGNHNVLNSFKIQCLICSLWSWREVVCYLGSTPESWDS